VRATRNDARLFCDRSAGKLVSRSVSNRASQSGVALAILVWFLAAMSLLVAGIVLQARVDIKLAQLHVTQARVEAAADGAIQLALADLMLREQEAASPNPVMQSQVFNVGGYNVAVTFTPVSGLININAAPEGLLLRLFSIVDDLDENAAHELAFNVVEWRSTYSPGEELRDLPTQGSGWGAYGRERDAKGTDAPVMGNVGYGRFTVIEDLLLVSGIDRRVFEVVQDAVHVGQVGQSGVDWALAPVAVLRALGDMDEDAAKELAEMRINDTAEGLVAPQEMDLSFQQASALSSYRIDALVELDGSVFNRRRWVNRTRPGSDGLPWSFFRTEAVSVMPQTEGEGLTLEEGVHAGS
jgi:general secretion pathway protein K